MLHSQELREPVSHDHNTDQLTTSNVSSVLCSQQSMEWVSSCLLLRWDWGMLVGPKRTLEQGWQEIYILQLQMLLWWTHFLSRCMRTLEFSISILLWDQIFFLGLLNVVHNLYNKTSSPPVRLLLISNLPLKMQTNKENKKGYVDIVTHLHVCRIKIHLLG